jgi:hypothetical protein
MPREDLRPMKSHLLSKAVLDEAFHCDGSLRDLYVPDASMDLWHQLFTFLQRRSYRLSLYVDGTISELPGDVREVFALRDKATPLLSVEVEGVTLNCHFFVEKEIELDFDPRQIAGVSQANAILKFMLDLGRFLDKEVRMTEENAPDCVIFRFNVATQEIEYVSPGASGN